MNTTAERESAIAEVPPAYVLETLCLAEEQLGGLLCRRAEIMRRISTLKKMLAGMASLFGDSILDDELLIALDRGTSGRRRGFTPACRQVLMESGFPLRARQASVELQQRFSELVRHHKDLSASVTTVFHRLVKYGQARCFVDDQGMKVWEWVKDRDVKMQHRSFMSQAKAEASEPS